jgi:hypothetical protein
MKNIIEQFKHPLKPRKLNRVDRRMDEYLNSKGEFSAETDIYFEKHLQRLAELKKHNRSLLISLWY